MSLLVKLEKYLSVMAISIKVSSAYKIKLFFYALTGITQFISYYYLWSSLYSREREYNGFTGGTILTYFVVSFLIQSIIPRWLAMDILSVICFRRCDIYPDIYGLAYNTYRIVWYFFSTLRKYFVIYISFNFKLWHCL